MQKNKTIRASWSGSGRRPCHAEARLVVAWARGSRQAGLPFVPGEAERARPKFRHPRGVAYDETRGWAWTLEALGSDVDSPHAAEQLHVNAECLQMKRSRGRIPATAAQCPAASQDTHMMRLACARICHLIP